MGEATRGALRCRVQGLLRHLPKGHLGLPEEVWERRHRGILLLLWLHIPFIFGFALIQGESAAHGAFEAAIILVPAGAATVWGSRRRLTTVLAAVGLLTSSAALVHLSDGLIEMHFHFFVIVGVVTLYQDWYPFVVSIGYVVLQHGVAGALAPEAVYNHPGAVENPWKWAAIHGAFILGISVAGIVTWRLNEVLLETASQREQALAEAQSVARLGSWERDLVTGEGRWSDEMFRVTGLPPDAGPPSAEATIELVVPEDRSRYIRWAEEAVTKGSATVDVRLQGDGEVRWLHCRARVTERAPDGTPLVLSGTGHDVSDHMNADSELRGALSLLGATLEATADGILVVDLKGRFTTVNKQFARMWNISDELLDTHDDEAALAYAVEQVCHPHRFMAKVRELYAHPEVDSHDTIEFKDGRTFERYSKPQRVGGVVVGRVWTFIDITQRRTLERELSHQAFHDSLTQLANQTLFRDRVDHALHRADRHGGAVAVLFMDLDDFKSVNDSLGHSVGDELLVAMAGRLRSCLRADDTSARLGGDEFAVLLEDIHDEEPEMVAGRILESLRSPFKVGGRELTVGASIGIALNTSDLDTEDLLRNADMAMYTAKKAGRGGFRTFEPGMYEAVLHRVELERGLTEAIERGQFVLRYQPVVNLGSGRLAGVEALLRWDHPEKGLLPPGGFIDAAEESGAIVDIGSWVLREACRQGREWMTRFPEQQLSMAVNVSPRQLFKQDFVSTVSSILRETRYPAANLVLELTEGIMLTDNEITTERLSDLKVLGVRLAVDDFGTGYSSMSYLRRLPFDILKIDKLFIDGIAEGPVESAFALAIIRLAQTLGLETVAEGIEHTLQAKELQKLGCELAQGYLFARPSDVPDMERLLSSLRYGAFALDGSIRTAALS
jgi:diguanylate cyclase (GGDEF)-like protein/PAS domain S-box-containing protein